MPESGYFAFPNVTEIMPSTELQIRLLEQGVMCLDGKHCGLDGYLRFAYTQPLPILEQAISRIKQAVAALKN